MPERATRRPLSTLASPFQHAQCGQHLGGDPPQAHSADRTECPFWGRCDEGRHHGHERPAVLPCFQLGPHAGSPHSAAFIHVVAQGRSVGCCEWKLDPAGWRRTMASAQRLRTPDAGRRVCAQVAHAGDRRQRMPRSPPAQRLPTLWPCFRPYLYVDLCPSLLSPHQTQQPASGTTAGNPRARNPLRAERLSASVVEAVGGDCLRGALTEGRCAVTGQPAHACKCQTTMATIAKSTKAAGHPSHLARGCWQARLIYLCMTAVRGDPSNERLATACRQAVRHVSLPRRGAPS